MSSDLPVVEIQSDEFLCVRCARHMKTCCQTSEVYVTPGDVRRIAEFTGDEDFHEYRRPEDPIYLQEDGDPVWIENVIRSDGTRRVLKRQANGDCTFLGKAGCVLPLETRPLICRIYPFDFTADGLRDTLASGCPEELIPNGQTLLQALDIKRSDAERWHRQLYQEVLTERTESKQR
ncbi:MAG: YkgJ family cysteine cluster protein [Planctomycetaceae bacterium]